MRDNFYTKVKIYKINDFDKFTEIYAILDFRCKKLSWVLSSISVKKALSKASKDVNVIDV